MSELIPVEEAQARILAAIEPLEAETVPLHQARGRVLAENVEARCTHPPSDISAMDGYAVRTADATAQASLTVIGESAAGRSFDRPLAPGETVRIFTGAPVPSGADAVVIQENVSREGDHATLNEAARMGANIRRKGLDFTKGDVRLAQGRTLNPFDISLAAAMNVPELPVHKRPLIAFFSTGDELVRPGNAPGPDQIVSSNNDGLAALIEAAGGEPVDLGIAADDADVIRATARGARRCHMLVTMGGASVGDHDLVQSALGSDGLTLDFWRIAMRPGKPLMFGSYGPLPMLGLPGNPVSALVCALLFLVPAIRKFQGAEPHNSQTTARLAAPLKANDQRQDYIRACYEREGGMVRVRPFEQQDSSMLSLLAASDCLIVRPPHAPAANTDDPVTILPLWT
ncbi:MAG: molybdopterin molybdotransferase MoeA [Parvibaculaceae bacterium]|nr:molybdopterin molybdotransferase MoeA [Parvibaculaceae bacterium]